MQCQNHLKQIGIALHNYHDTCQAFPAGVSPGQKKDAGTAAGNNARWLSVLIALTPFFEQNAVMDAVAAKFISAPTQDPQPGNGEPWNAHIAAILCPSDPAGVKGVMCGEGWGTGKASYANCVGDWADVTDASLPVSPPSIPNTRGLFPGRWQWNAFTSITDGTSNTVAMAERVIAPAAGMSVRGHIALDTASMPNKEETKAKHEAVLPNKAKAQSTNQKEYISTATLYGITGTRWGDGRSFFSSFSTVLPPNSVSVLDKYSAPVRVMVAASSFHSGGVNTVYADASVHFVSETVDAGSISDTTQLNVNGGASNFGVWGALGSINGGEAKGL